jgi:hypothetical protein
MHRRTVNRENYAPGVGEDEHIPKKLRLIMDYKPPAKKKKPKKTDTSKPEIVQKGDLPKVTSKIEKRKSYFKVKKEKRLVQRLSKTLKKLQKKNEREEDEKVYDEVEFGEQAQQPPTLAFKPKKSKKQ